VNVWKNTTLSNGHTTEKLVQLLIVADSQLDVTRDDSSLLVVSSGVTGQLKDLSGQVLKDSSQVDWSTSSNTGGVLALLQEAANSADRELKASLGTLGLRLLAVLSTATFATFTGTHFSNILCGHFD
jgi:hypothetical protein